MTKECASPSKFNLFVSVQGLGFLMLHLGVDASSPLSFGGELLDGKYVLSHRQPKLSIRWRTIELTRALCR